MPLIKIIKIHCLYTFYEFKSRLLNNILTVILYLGLLFFSTYQRMYFIERNNFDNMTISDVIYFLLVIRMIIGSLSIPYNILENEINKYQFYHKYTLVKCGSEKLIFIQICMNLINAFLINILTTYGIIFNLNLVFDFRNYLILSFPLLIGMFTISIIGYIIAAIGLFLDLKREMISFIQVGILVLFMQIKHVTILFPFSVIRSMIHGIISSDIVFTEVYEIKFEKIGYLILSLIISLILSFVVLNLIGLIYRNKKVKGVYSEVEINT